MYIDCITTQQLDRSQCITLEEAQQKWQDLINVLQTDYNIKK